MKKITDFTDLEAWKRSHKVVLIIYSITNNFPKSELFGLTSQLRRAGVSITSNIAEGFGRNTYKERAHFYISARGSMSEIRSQLILAKDLNYLSLKDYENIVDELDNAHRLLQGLINKTKTFSNL